MTGSLTCDHCYTRLLKPASLCGFCDGASLVTAIADLTARKPAPAYAVWTLRELGCTPAMVKAIRREVCNGRSVDEVAAVVEQVLGRVGTASIRTSRSNTQSERKAHA